MTARIKKGDLVEVIAGKDRGEKGRVLQVVRADLILVEGVNRVKRHQSPRRFAEAVIVEKEMPIHASNVMLVDPKTEERTRVRIEADKKDPDKRVRVAVKSGSPCSTPRSWPSPRRRSRAALPPACSSAIPWAEEGLVRCFAVASGPPGESVTTRRGGHCICLSR